MEYYQRMIDYADVIVDLQYGDSGKGKIANHLTQKNDYTHVVRYNGGNNAGHTIYLHGKKIITHAIPVGVLHGIKSIIGPGCVLNVKHFFNEIEELISSSVKVDGLIKIAGNTHIITDEHLNEDSADTKIGTTRKGNGPAYRDKYSRKGIRACDVPELKPYIIDLYEEFHGIEKCKILFEGAQGFNLDIDWGDYPYVTSSHCTAGSAALNGVPVKKIRKIWGAAKIYETYVGSKKFEPDDAVFKKIREIGQEYGTTTGRPRQCNWIDVNNLIKASRINGVTDIVISKTDVLKQLGKWSLYNRTEKIDFVDEIDMKKYITKCLDSHVNIHWSGNPESF